MELFQRDDWTLFRNLTTLGQKAGVALERLPLVVAKELADNALDAGTHVAVGLCGSNGFYVADDGPGLPVSTPQELAALFSIRRPLTSSKLWRLPTRGALGNGLRVVAGVVLATGGTLTVTSRGQVVQLTPQEDGSTVAEIVGTAVATGTRVDVHLGPALQVDASTLAYVNLACILAEGGETYKGKTSPHWYDGDSFFELLQASGSRPVREVVAHLDGCTGAKAGLVAAAFLGRTACSLTRDDAELLLGAARVHARRVNPERLGRIGPRLAVGAAYATSAGTLTMKAARGHLDAILPCIVEAWIEPQAPAEADRRVSFVTCVNKTPVTSPLHATHDRKDAVLYIHGDDLYIRAKVGRSAPRRVSLNIQTPYMPLTSDGKAPDLSSFKPLIIEVIEKAARRVHAAQSRPVTPTRGVKESTLAHLAEAVAQASSGGRYRFSQRQLFYVVRPFIAAETGQEPNYETFTSNLTDYEEKCGRIADLYRDPRGTLYHPHTGEEIPVGTLAVEQYSRPDWTFNKILYCEKEGFFSILKSELWPERHDCALLTSKGQASRAAKDLLDLLGEGDEELDFYCIHDADAAGTMIYQALQQETKTRKGRKVRIINLGLEPWEALDMGLAQEKVTYGKRQPVAGYVSHYAPDEPWADWLQTHRVELNAMTTATFLTWLDSKMETHGHGKIIPPPPVLRAQFIRDVRSDLRERIAERVLAEANVPQLVNDAYSEIEPSIFHATGDLAEHVREELAAAPAEAWSRPIKRKAQALCADVATLIPPRSA